MILGLFGRSLPPTHSSCFPNQISIRRAKKVICADSIERQQILANNTSPEATCMKVFVLSDLHTDYPENMAWIKSISTTKRKKDVLLVAGDVAETFKNFVLTMTLLKDRFKHVFYVPGNHDLWCRREEEKYACKDFHACRWPEGLSKRDAALSVYFDNMNERNQALIKEIQKTCSQLITFSHFLPRQELCPEKRMLFYPNLHKIIGSDLLEVRIRSVIGTEGSPSACHVFGHTHFCWDAVLDGIRYVQAPLAYPRERKRRMNGGEDWLPFCVYSNGKFSERLNPCYWSDYYSINPRDPTNTQLARFYRRY